jgi:cysteinyl-tRNA synthetase
LAIVDFDIIDELEQEIPEKILKILEDRDNAKKKKDFDLADTLRNELTTL